MNSHTKYHEVQVLVASELSIALIGRVLGAMACLRQLSGPTTQNRRNLELRERLPAYQGNVDSFAASAITFG